MGWPLIAAVVGSSLLGAIGGRKQAKASNQPTVSRLTPSSELGGYDRINQALNRLRDSPGYSVGSRNPYMGATFSHILGRAGMQAPEGGWPNPYLQGMQEKSSGPQLQLSPEHMEELRRLLTGGGSGGSGGVQPWARFDRSP